MSKLAQKQDIIFDESLSHCRYICSESFKQDNSSELKKQKGKALDLQGSSKYEQWPACIKKANVWTCNMKNRQ